MKLLQDFSKVQDLHDKAMDLAEEAFIARLKGDTEKSEQFFRQACENEAQAARLISDESAPEPTRSVLYRSAASLALELSKFREAERLAAAGLAGNPPEEIADELREVYEKANFHRHLELRGIFLESDEIQMSLAGSAISAGVALTEEFVKRIEDIQNLVYRTVERKMNRPYRRSGSISSEVRNYTTFVSVPRAASFAVSIKIGQPEQLSLKFSELNSDQIIDEILTCLELFHDSKGSELQQKIFEPSYYRNFVTTASDIAPDGDAINLVGFTATRDGKERKVELTKARGNIDLPLESLGDLDSDETREVISISGRLKRTDATNDERQMIRLIDEENDRSHTVIFREGTLDDIVKRLWNQYVPMEVLRVRDVMYFRRLL